MPIIVLVTIPQEAAQTLATILLESRLCACVNILPGVTSLFWWEGKIDTATESLLIIKTKAGLFDRLTVTVQQNHPYTVPEIISYTIERGNKEYLDWINEQTDE